MARRHNRLAIPAFAIICLGGETLPRADDSPSLLSHRAAVESMLQAINRDRAGKGLPPVQLDETASRAAQVHAEEMAVNRFLAHADLKGRFPDQRYTEAGGRDAAQENVLLFVSHRAGAELRPPLRLAPNPLYSSKQIEDMQAAYFNEIPPDDGHRRNILTAQHTHVGLGFARAEGEAGYAVANAQLFVTRSVDADGLPQEARRGAVLKVTGRRRTGVEVIAVTVAWDPLPKPTTPDKPAGAGGYRIPHAVLHYWPDPGPDDGLLRVEKDGSFRADVRLDIEGKAGVYQVCIWVKDRAGSEYAASRRTIVVR